MVVPGAYQLCPELLSWPQSHRQHLVNFPLTCGLCQGAAS